MATIFQIVYRSFASKEISTQDIAEILEASRKNNTELNVTGMLLFQDGIFFQMLEGSKEDVEFTYNKILRDSRHNNLRIFLETKNDQRSFPNWSMAFKDTEELKQSNLKQFQDLINLHTSDEIKPSSCLDFFLSIKDDL